MRSIVGSSVHTRNGVLRRRGGDLRSELSRVHFGGGAVVIVLLIALGACVFAGGASPTAPLPTLATPIFMEARYTHPQGRVCVPLGRRPPSATCEGLCAWPPGRHARQLPSVFSRVVLSLERASSYVVVNLGTAAGVVAASQGGIVLDFFGVRGVDGPRLGGFVPGPLGVSRLPIPSPGESANISSFFRSTGMSCARLFCASYLHPAIAHPRCLVFLPAFAHIAVCLPPLRPQPHLRWSECGTWNSEYA